MFVCGDSFLSPSVVLPGQHMSEIISKRLGFDLVPLARGGMSNIGICLQIELAIKKNADFVLLTTTQPDRIEIPLENSLEYTIEDIYYSDSRSLSSKNRSSNKNCKVIIDTLLSFTSDGGHDYTKLYDNISNIDNIKRSVRESFKYTYQVNWKKKTDLMALYSSLHQLHISSIPYLIVLDCMDIHTNFPWINSKNNILNFWHKPVSRPVNVKPGQFIFSYGANLDVEKLKTYEDPGFHTMPEDQECIAEIILEHISKNKLVNL